MKRLEIDTNFWRHGIICVKNHTYTSDYFVELSLNQLDAVVLLLQNCNFLLEEQWLYWKKEQSDLSALISVKLKIDDYLNIFCILAKLWINITTMPVCPLCIALGSIIAYTLLGNGKACFFISLLILFLIVFPPMEKFFTSFSHQLIWNRSFYNGLFYPNGFRNG